MAPERQKALLATRKQRFLSFLAPQLACRGRCGCEYLKQSV
ncbi:hypothetical protein GJA_1181 [Janthinobacterium agaricidamnosum NBRC 102515 = DSM 9628]|uniref:Uncharacterized protein n=1 Tax=Janthinobacterium agaricidamnosum NBRC 102515 = DSM 9628 TaxID=1349767 RepID=W0UZ47_9BURK|nr:hypothetical protein GJA_1181 [Janthinobacterium agaricidamnosum NBRC 102515 = DSM 9628]